MTFLNLFPIPRRYEWLPGAAAFALTAAAVISCIVRRSQQTMFFALAAVALLVLVYVIRFRQRKEWAQFFQQENARLLKVKGAEGPTAYIPAQRQAVTRLRNPELKAIAQLNLASVLAADADPQGARTELEQIDPRKLSLLPLQLLYWSQMLCACINLNDTARAEAAYGAALSVLDEVNDPLKNSFLPYQIQYDLYCGEYEQALAQVKEIPLTEMDESGRDVLQALRARALWGLGVTEKALAITEEVAAHDLIPSTRALLQPIAP